MAEERWASLTVLSFISTAVTRLCMRERERERERVGFAGCWLISCHSCSLMLWFSVQVDEFEVEAVTLLKLRKIRIGHDGRGVGAGWFLDKVVVGQVDTDKYDTEFVCNRWV